MKRPPAKRNGQALGRRRIDGEVLDVAGVARLLGTSEKTIRSRVARQQLPHRRWGGRVVFLRGELLAFLAKLDGCSIEKALERQASSGAAD